MRVNIFKRHLDTFANTSSTKTIFKVYSTIMLLLAFSLFIPKTIFIKPAIGLDPSWLIALNLIKAKNLAFGKDVIFNYGPLGYFFTRLPITVGKWHYFLWDCLILFNLAFVFFYIFRKLKTFRSILAVVLSVALMPPMGTYWPVEHTIFLIFMFLLFLYMEQGSIFSLIMAPAFCLILFYYKFNMGIASLFLMFTFLAYILIYPKRHNRAFLSIYSILFVLILLISPFFFNTDPLGYVRGGMHLVSGFNDAMYLTTWHDRFGVEYFIMALIILFSFSLVFLLKLKEIVSDRVTLMRFAFTGIFLFLLYKHGFVRADEHVFIFFSVVSAGIGLLCLFVPGPINNYLSKVLIISLIFSYYALGKIHMLEEIPTRVSNVISYPSDLFQAQPFNIENPELEKNRLPESILRIIDDKSVDVIPWEISYLYVNNLDYNPRPTIHSYQAYDDYLDVKNYEKYMSGSAPDFILFSVGTINNRHPFFEESKTKLAILTSYQLISKTGDNLLFRKLKFPRETVEEPSEIGASELGKFIRLEDTSNLQYMTANIKYSLMGKIVRILFQPPRLFVTIKFDDGEQLTYKAVKTIVNGEVLVNKFVGSTDDAYLFFRYRGEKSRNVEEIKFDSPQRWGFTNNFTYRIRYVEVEGGFESLDK